MLFCPELMGKVFFFSQLKARFQSRAVNKPLPNNRNTFFNATYHNISYHIIVLASFVTCCNMLGFIGSSKKTLYSWSAIELICDFLRTMLNYKESLFIFDSFLLLVPAEFAEILDRKIWLVQEVYLRVTARTLFYWVHVFNCQEILANISFALFFADILQQFCQRFKRLLTSCVFL